MMATRFQEMFGKYYAPLAAVDIMKENGMKRDYIHRVGSDHELDDDEAYVSCANIIINVTVML